MSITLTALKKAKEELEDSISNATHAAICRFTLQTGIKVDAVRVREVFYTDADLAPKYISMEVSLDLDL